MRPDSRSGLMTISIFAQVWWGTQIVCRECVPMQTTNDAAIRDLLIPFVRDEYTAPDTIILEEFALYGGINRADIAVLNGVSHGYEIKSDRDTLIRLPQQVQAY